MHKPRLRKSVLLLTLIITLLLTFSSCSAVFTANLGGKVRDDESDSGIADMSIFAYTNSVQREDDWKRYTGGTFNPSNAAGYVARTSSDADGSFVINKIIWESVFPEFGKTADYKEIALLFYHEDYGLHKNKNSVWITSDSSNVSIVDEKFSKANQTTNVQIYLRDAKDETLIDQNFDVRLIVEQKPGDLEGKVERETIRGEGIIPVTYPVGLEETAVTATATLHNSSWMQCDEEGVKITDNNPATFEASGNNSKITLYLKQSRHNFPLISGEIDSEDRDGTEKASADNSLIVWLGERKDGKISLFDKGGAQTITRSEGTGANNSVIRHGIFSNLGENMHWEDADYPGTYAKKEVLLVVDMDRDGELSVGDCYYEFIIRSDDKNPKELRKLRWDENNQNDYELQQVIANDLP